MISAIYLFLLLASPAHADFIPRLGEVEQTEASNLRSISEEIIRTDLTSGGTIQVRSGGEFALYISSADGTPLLRIEHAGNFIFGTSASISTIDTGTYTPTLTNTTNIDASTAFATNFVRVGSRVIVYGIVNIDPTSSATATVLNISLPVATDFSASLTCRGAFGAVLAERGGVVSGNATDDTARLRWTTEVTGNTEYSFIFGYEIK